MCFTIIWKLFGPHTVLLLLMCVADREWFAQICELPWNIYLNIESSENEFFSFQSLSGDAEATAAISVGIEHHIPWNQRQQRQLLYRVQWWKEVAQIHLYLPVSFPTIYHFVLFVYFCKPAVLSRGYIFDGDNRSLIGRAADSKERKEVHEMRVVAVGEWRVYGGLGDIITPPV